MPKITITNTRKPQRNEEKETTNPENSNGKDETTEDKDRIDRKEKPTRKEKIENFADILWGFSEANAGVGMLSFRKQGTLNHSYV